VWKDGGRGVDRTGWDSNVRAGKAKLNGLWSWRRRRRRGRRRGRIRRSYLLMGKPDILELPFRIIIIIFINCNWIVTQWQWLFYMYTKYEIGY